ncbi:VPA1262 family protein [Noviherbaspirillum malthae]|uniref:VPA1262 family protein n=1 Tax=Noviherbaspirillum malthae TaxID=1260987 RepID=UPI00188F387F|nr:VPA1262 family protein [Noviherbaspirillum malthae]
MNNDFTKIFSDARLDRIVGERAGPCAVELWVLQFKSGERVANKLAYGRVLPCTFANDTWHTQREDTLTRVNDCVDVQVKRVAAFVTGGKVRPLLLGLCEGGSLAQASCNAGLNVAADAVRFASLTLGETLITRPVMHLPARDYFRFSTNRLSPSSMASMDSAAITPVAKSELFEFEGRAQPDVVKLVLDILSSEMGLDFTGIDAWRTGDLEIGNFPSLTDDERPTVEIEAQFKASVPGVRVRIVSPLGGIDEELELEVQLLNDDALFHVAKATIRHSQKFPVEVWFAVPNEYQGMVTALTVQIDAYKEGVDSRRRVYQWGTTLIREMCTQMHVRGSTTRVASDWLAKAVRSRDRKRLEAAQELSRQTHTSRQTTRGVQVDAWVDINRQMTRVVRDLAPEESTGRFFERYSEGENTGRLELAEWLKRLFAEHQDKHIAWFDPYMEDVGVSLINQYGFTEGNYVIFTQKMDLNLVDQWHEHILYWNSHGALENQPDTPVGTRITRLVSACRVWKEQLSSVRMKVVGLPEGTLHDRMIVIRDERMEPVVGYHLSNSIQKANENYPLLITPIPPDILRKICNYADQMLERVAHNVFEAGSDDLTPMILFDSSSVETERPQAEVVHDAFSLPLSGKVFAWWSGDHSLETLSGDALRERLRALGHIDENNGLHSELFRRLPDAFWSYSGNAKEFSAWWDALSLVFAQSPAGSYITDLQDNPSRYDPGLGTALCAYLDPDRSGARQPSDRGPVRDIMERFNESHEDLLPSAHWLQGFDIYASSLFWGDRYAIKVLWYFDPMTLVRWMEDQSVLDAKNRRRQLELYHALSRISLSIGFGASDQQLDALLASKNAYIRWYGLLGLEQRLIHSPQLVEQVRGIDRLSPVQRAGVLGWLLAQGRNSTTLRAVVLVELLSTLPETIDKTWLDPLLNSMRNPLRRLYDNPPWILGEILAPLIEGGKLSTDLAAEAWVAELLSTWRDADERGSLLFKVNMEGAFTSEVAALLALTSESGWRKLLKPLNDEMRRITQVTNRPLAHQRDYSTTHDASVKALWIACLVRLVIVNTPRPMTSDRESALTKLHQSAVTVAKRWTWSRRSITDSALLEFWRQTRDCFGDELSTDDI